MTDERTHALYRFHAHDGTLLYVGITATPTARWRQHAHDKPWWHDVATITIEPHPTREAVLEAERAAIIAERPLHNVMHNRRPAHATAQLPPPEPPAPVDPLDMPDDCHDHCVPAGHLATYAPYRWHSTGEAFYQCARGHRWTCWWPNTATTAGDAPQHRGTPVEVYR